MAKRIVVGDVFEIAVPNGVAYGQVTHRHGMGDVIRVFRGVEATKPPDVAVLADRTVQFVALFPLAEYVRAGDLKIVGTLPVPGESREFPVFRAGNAGLRGEPVRNWYLWDGEVSRKIGALTPEQRRLPIEELISLETLIARIQSGWTPETDPR